MRIHLGPKGPESPDVLKPAKPRVPNANREASTGDAQDRTVISQNRQRVQALSQQVSGFPDVREQKVSALRAAVRDGSYRPSSEATAQAMLREMFRSVA